MKDYTGYSDYLNKLKEENYSKSEELISLQEKFKQANLALEAKEKLLFEMEQDEGGMVGLQQEQIEMLRAQLKENPDFLKEIFLLLNFMPFF